MRKKLRCMVFCIAEAIRKRKQQLFRVCRQVCLMHDGANSKLFWRFSLCTAEHKRESGLLCVDNLVEKHTTQDTLALANSMKHITQNSVHCVENAPFEKAAWRATNGVYGVRPLLAQEGHSPFQARKAKDVVYGV